MKKIVLLVVISSFVLASCAGLSKQQSVNSKESSGQKVEFSEKIYTVQQAQSVKNIYKGIVLPQNPNLAKNSFSGGHNDSYCSDSVGLSGPVSMKKRVVKKFNPYGLTSIMASNSKNQMVGISFSFEARAFTLIVFDKDLNIISATKTATFDPPSFAGGYFYLNHKEEAIVVGNNKMACYPTSNVEKREKSYELKPLWTSKDIVEMVTGSTKGNALYNAFPVWDKTNPNLYWCLIPGQYDEVSTKLNSHAYMAVVEIIPDTGQPNGCTTTLIDAIPLPGEWNNNVFAADKEGAYFVTNAMSSANACDDGYLHAVSFDPQSKKIASRWKYRYKNAGYEKVGTTNTGSGTTPTLVDDEDGNRFVVFSDNDSPKMNVVVVNRDNGSLVAEIPVFPKMRSAGEASIIGVGNHFVMENNFGHRFQIPVPQYIGNEPGFAMIQLNSKDKINPMEIIWEDTKRSMFAMSMLARESGIIFAHTGSWSDDISSVEGGFYSVSAFDAWDGRVIWDIPLGRGPQWCHEYGGIYFDRNNNLYIGTFDYLVSIQDYVEPVLTAEQLGGKTYKHPSPSFSISYPEDMSPKKPESGFYFTATKGLFGLPNINVKPVESFTTAADSAKDLIKVLQDTKNGSKFEILSEKKIKLADGTPAFETIVSWKHPMIPVLYTCKVLAKKGDNIISVTMTDKNTISDGYRHFMKTLQMP